MLGAIYNGSARSLEISSSMGIRFYGFLVRARINGSRKVVACANDRFFASTLP